MKYVGRKPVEFYPMQIPQNDTKRHVFMTEHQNMQLFICKAKI